MIGFPEGLAIIGNVKAGEDTQILYEGEDTLTPYEKTSCYYQFRSPVGTYADGWLYVFAYSLSEPERCFFRATQLDGTKESEPAAAEEPAPEEDQAAEAGTDEQASETNGRPEAPDTAADTAPAGASGHTLPVIILICAAAACIVFIPAVRHRRK